MQTDDAQSLKVQPLFLFLATLISIYLYVLSIYLYISRHRYRYRLYRFELLLGLKFYTGFIGTEVLYFVYSG